MKYCTGVLILLLGFVFVSHADDRVLKVGTLVFNPPFELSSGKGNLFSGFEIDIVTTICQRLNVTCQFVSVFSMKDILLQLAEERFDLAVGSVIALRQDPDHVYSTTYLPSSIQFFTQKDSSLSNLNDVVASRIGTIDDPLLQALLTVDYAKTYPLQVFPSAQAGVDALASGKIDVFVMQTPASKYWITNAGGAFKMVSHPIPMGFGNGIIALKEADKLMAQINQVLLDMQQDGTYELIHNRYLLE